MSAGDFDGCPEGLAFGRPRFRNSPSLNVKLYSFAQVGASRFDVSALGRDTQLGAAGDTPGLFFCDWRGEPLSHEAMLTKEL